MAAFCGTEDADEAVEVWKTVTPVADGPNAGYPLLVVQGGEDPMVSLELGEMLLQHAPTDDKQMVVFSDGNHCVYNHRQDRDVLIADWMRARLSGLPRPEMPN
jgi:esterase/lipase